jgi:hypothetical protein
MAVAKKVLTCICGASAPDDTKNRTRFRIRHPDPPPPDHLERIKFKKLDAARKKDALNG